MDVEVVGLATTNIVGAGSYANGDLVFVDGFNSSLLIFDGTSPMSVLSSAFTAPTAVVIDLYNSIAYVAQSAGSIKTVTLGGVDAVFIPSGLSSPTCLAFSSSTAVSGGFPSSTILLYVGESNGIRSVNSAGNISSYLVAVATATTLSPSLGASALALSSTGDYLLIVESANNCVRMVALGGGAVTTFAGFCGAASGVLDAAGTSARFASPGGLAVTSSGSALVSDTAGFTLRSITPAGAVTTVAGLAGTRGSLDGAGASARLYAPGALVVTPQGDAYLIDQPAGAFSEVRSLT